MIMATNIVSKRFETGLEHCLQNADGALVCWMERI